jgi:3-methyladenine DNA glycosylase/8-oxoguanine DNA glycosylase
VLSITGDKKADRLLSEDPLALLIGMLLDQQVPMERAFTAPADLSDRLGRALDAASHRSVADIDSPAALAKVREHKRKMKAQARAEASAQG